MIRKILIIYVGGTIGLVKNLENNLVLIPKTFENVLRKKIKEKKDKTIPLFDFLELDNIMESNNISSKEWINITKIVKEYYEEYDSFIIVTGTDTMAFLASSLSFMFENLHKSVILTGAIIPLYHKDTDGLSNVLCSLNHAKSEKYKEVCICFGKKIFRGNRCTKISNLAKNAFLSPNHRLLQSQNKQKNEIPPLITFLKMKTKFIVLRITPNFDYMSLIVMLQNVTTLKIIIIELYGLGTGPTHEDRLIKVLKICNQKQILVLGVTQNIFGGLQEVYNITNELQKNGLLFGKDMTTEAASTKICYLYGKYGNNLNMIKQMLNKNLRGEITSI